MTNYVRTELDMYPSLLKNDDQTCFMLVHVDDVLVVCSR